MSPPSCLCQGNDKKEKIHHTVCVCLCMFVYVYLFYCLSLVDIDKTLCVDIDKTLCVDIDKTLCVRKTVCTPRKKQQILKKESRFIYFFETYDSPVLSALFDRVHRERET